jgi:hypothetical protein
MSLNKSLLADIQKKMSKPSKPKVPRNQWQHPGEITNIPSNNITMDGVSYPVLGVPNIGQAQMMYPNQDYLFPDADNVTEYPMMQNGGLLSRSVTCSSCGHSWKAVDGGSDPMTCHKCGGSVKMQGGGTAYVDSVLNANKNLNWVQRLYPKNTPSMQIPGVKGPSTHYMQSGDSRVYPTVVQMPNGTLKYLGKDAFDYADSTKTYIQFPNDAAATWFGENYKKGTGVLPKNASGGQHGGLDRWFAEKWVDVKTGKDCGRQEGESRKGYPACRPSKRVNDDTPKTSSELSSAEKAKFTREKTSSDKINYQHRRREFGGEEMYNDMEEFKSGGNVPTNPSLWSRAKSMARQKYDVYPSAYANGWAAKWYKSKGGGWKKAEYGMEVEMQKGGSLYDYMAARGMDADFSSRKKVFDKYFANNYKGTAEQNKQMLNMLQYQEKPRVNINYASPAVQSAMPAYVPTTQTKATAKGMQRVNNKVDNRNWFERTFGMNEDEVQEQSFDLPQDVYNYYNQYAEKNKGKKFGIVSKQNARGYFFDENGNLALQDEVGLGQDAGDEQPVFYKKRTTPSGEYTMNRAGKGNTSATDYGKNYGSDNFFYIQHTDPNKRLLPDPANPNRKVSVAMHGIPTHLLGDREKLFDNNKVSDNRMSAGCINCRKKTLDNPYFKNVGANTSLYVTPEKAYGGGTDNPGFKALPEFVQAKIMSNMAYGGSAQQAAIAMAMKAAGKKPKAQYAEGGKMPEEIARARFAAAGNLDKMDDYGYAYGGYMPFMGDGGQPDGEMALSQINAMMDKLDKLRKFIKPDSDLEPWQASKITLMDDFAGSVYDNMMYSPENQEMTEEQMEQMANGGYTVSRSNDRKGKTHKVTGPDGTVKYFGDSNLGQHPKDPERKAAFYARHKKNLDNNPFFRAFARKTWKDGGSTFSGNAFYEAGGMPCFECGGSMKNGGQHSVGDEMEVTPAQMAELKRLGYTFEVL